MVNSTIHSSALGVGGEKEIENRKSKIQPHDKRLSIAGARIHIYYKNIKQPKKSLRYHEIMDMKERKKLGWIWENNGGSSGWSQDCA